MYIPRNLNDLTYSMCKLITLLHFVIGHNIIIYLFFFLLIDNTLSIDREPTLSDDYCNAPAAFLLTVHSPHQYAYVRTSGNTNSLIWILKIRKITFCLHLRFICKIIWIISLKNKYTEYMWHFKDLIKMNTYFTIITRVADYKFIYIYI